MRAALIAVLVLASTLPVQARQTSYSKCCPDCTTAIEEQRCIEGRDLIKGMIHVAPLGGAAPSLVDEVEELRRKVQQLQRDIDEKN